MFLLASSWAAASFISAPARAQQYISITPLMRSNSTPDERVSSICSE